MSDNVVTYKNPDEKRGLVRECIRQNPTCTYMDIKRATKIKIERIYRNMADAFLDAGVPLPDYLKKRSLFAQKQAVASFIRKNPCCSVTDIVRSVGVNVSRVFSGIMEAYAFAGCDYPERQQSGVVHVKIAKRCRSFEMEMIDLLKFCGIVKPKVKCSAGIVDCVLECGTISIVVEIKDFRARNNITMSQLRQLAGYMHAMRSEYGLLICPKSALPKRKNGRNVYIGNLNLLVITAEELRGRSINLLDSFPRRVQPG